MFLSKKIKLINSYRHRKQLMWHIFAIKNIKEKYLKKNYYNFVENKLNTFLYKGFFFNKYNKKIYSILTDKDNNNILNPCKYGFEVGKIQSNYKFNIMEHINEINKMYLIFIKPGYFIYNIQNNFNNNKICFSEGTFAILIKHIKDIGMTELKLPSGQIKLFNSYNNAYLGRGGNIFKKYIVWGSWGFKHKNKNHFPSVRGVAMNPIDHPNGGRTKIKKPFKNKYNKIAKKGK